METRFFTDFEGADAGLTPNPYGAVVANGGNTVALGALSGIASAGHRSQFAGVSADAYGTAQLPGGDLVVASGRVVADAWWNGNVLPFVGLSSVGQPILRLMNTAGTALLTCWLYKNGSAAYRFRLVYTPTAANSVGIAVPIDSTWFRITMLLSGEPGAERAALYINGEGDVEFTGIGAIPDVRSIRVGGIAGTAIPIIATEYNYDNITVAQGDDDVQYIPAPLQVTRAGTWLRV